MTRKTDRPRKILLVEDNSQDIFFFQHALRKVSLRADLVVCRDGDETQKLLEERMEAGRLGIDLVLLDLNLPRVHGLEVLRWIRQHDMLRTIPVLVMTTSDDPQVIDEVYRSGGNCFIHKPAGMREFIQVLDGIDQFWFGTARIPSV